MNLIVRKHEGRRTAEQEIEVVERKGVGHPDSMCDGIAEHISTRLCRHYLERFGSILHHNVDKVLLCGGSARAEFGGGEMLEPIEIYLAGRATDTVGGERIPVRDIAADACREWLEQHMRHLDVARDVRIIPRLRPGSADLTGLFARRNETPASNDTSCGVGFAPFTDLERVVLGVERSLNSPATKAMHPAIGEDIKVMGVRREGRIVLTIGCALVAKHIDDAAAYVRAKATAREVALAAARAETALEVDAIVNAADDEARGERYITVTGTSAEAGDDGEVGRGNRANGLITPYRMMTLEAAAGKNPVSHVGKLYNLLAAAIAQAVVAELPQALEASCMLLSQIGRPVVDPWIADVRVWSSTPLDPVRSRIGGIVHERLARIDELRAALLAEEITVF